MSFSYKNVKKNYLIGPFSNFYSSNGLESFSYLSDMMVTNTLDNIMGMDVNEGGFWATVYSGGSSGQCPGPDFNDGILIDKVVGNESKKYLAVKIRPDNETDILYPSSDNITDNELKKFYLNMLP